MENQIFISERDFDTMTFNQILNRRDDVGQTIEWVELESITINRFTAMDDKGEQSFSYYINQLD